MSRILIVEDDAAMSVALRDGFAFEGHEVVVANDGEEGLRQARGGWDVIILDVMLPRLSGLDVCKILRNEQINTPIIMLTARGQEIDKIVGLRVGADDYVTKPFSFMELLARVDAVLRRSAMRRAATQTAEFGDVVLRFDRFEATKQGEAIDLSPREFRILRFFLDHAGEVVPRETLLNQVWGYDSSAFSRTVDTHVARLRQKIESIPSSPRHLLTVHRVGYKFVV